MPKQHDTVRLHVSQFSVGKIDFSETDRIIAGKRQAAPFAYRARRHPESLLGILTPSHEVGSTGREEVFQNQTVFESLKFK